MLEWALRSLLKSYLDDYVDGLDTNLDCSQFPVRMHNLTLKEQKMKKTVFKEDHPNSIFIFNHGSIGSVDIELSWSGKAQIVASDVILNLDFSPMKVLKRLVMPRRNGDSHAIGAHAFSDAQHAMDNAVPRYCVNHCTPMSRRKVDPRWTECSRCRFKLQTNFAELSLCPVCSQQEIRCMCCGTFAPFPPGTAPGAAASAPPGGLSQGAGGGLSAGGRGPRSQGVGSQVQERANSEPLPVHMDPNQHWQQSLPMRAGSLGPARGPASGNRGLMRAHGEGAPVMERASFSRTRLGAAEDPWNDNVSDSGSPIRGSPTWHHSGADDGGVPQESMAPKPLTMRSLFLKRGRPQAQPARGRSPGPGAKLVTPTPSLDMTEIQSHSRVPTAKVMTPRAQADNQPLAADHNPFAGSPFGAAENWTHVPEPEYNNSRVQFGRNEVVPVPSRHPGLHQQAAEGLTARGAGALAMLDGDSHALHAGAMRDGRPVDNDGWETIPDNIMAPGSKPGKVLTPPGRGPPAPPTHTMQPHNFRNGLRPNSGLGADARMVSPMQSPGMPRGASGRAASPMQSPGMPRGASGRPAHGIAHGADGPPGLQDWEAVPTDIGTQGHTHHMSRTPGLGPPGMNMHRAWDQDTDRADTGSLRHLERSQNLGRLHADSQPHMHPAAGLAQGQRAWEEDSTGARASNQEDPMSSPYHSGSPYYSGQGSGDHPDWYTEPPSEDMQEDAGVPVRGYVMDHTSTAQRNFGAGAAAISPPKKPEPGSRSHPDWRLDFFD